jgi:NSS family neurotransmitter:Na+ symporter
MNKESWTSRAGFIFAAAGSAVGLVNIWRFPYIVGQHGGGAFIVIYLFCLVLIGFPLLISEVLMGRTAQEGPVGAFRILSGSRGWSKHAWSGVGKGLVITGFIVSSFYSVVAGWIVGYLIEALRGTLHMESMAEAASHFNMLISSPTWVVGWHFVFMLLSTAVLYFGVRHGIERSNKIMMPLLLLLLVVIAVQGVGLPGGSQGMAFLFRLDWAALTPVAFLAALGHAFFTLSLGQGTMITYGGYLRDKHNIATSCAPVAIFDTVISLLAGIAILSVVFAAGAAPDAGPALLFQTLPTVFSQLPGGTLMAILFFLLVFMAALTSQISAMEPLINYLASEKGWVRHRAVIFVGAGAFALGIPSAFSFNLLKNATFFGHTFFDFVSYVTCDLMIPLGGLLAVLYVGWAWGFNKAYPHLQEGAGRWFEKRRWVRHYLWLCIKYFAPLAILVIFMYQLAHF